MRKLIFIFLFVFLYSSGSAILPPLEREVNLSFSNEQFGTVLNRIQEQTGIIFSYKPSIISGIAPVSMQLRHKTVREALALMLPKTVMFKSKNNYIILKEKPEEKNPKKTEINGYVYDKVTEQKVANVTIYDKESLQSVTTDEYGYYSISVPTTNQKISINKENYQDTTLSLNAVKENKINNIVLEPVTESQRKNDSTQFKDKLKDIGLYTGKIYRRFKGFVNTVNVRDTIHRAVQVSLIPFIGTNHRLSGNVENRLSFNILGGFAKGTHGFEIGTVFNIDRENVKGTQLAGVMNIVGDTMAGAQLAGFMNITGNYMKGFQAAGGMNINNRGIKGVGIAGMMNISSSVNGVQVATIGNINDTLRGAAIGAVFNATDYGKDAVQISCIFNRQKKGSSSVQIAGLYNKACYVKGIQIALLNFADSAKGVPMGLFSFVKKGVHQIELGADELSPLNISFRTGVPSFYNIFSFSLVKGNDYSQFGYGVGTSWRFSDKLRGDATFTMHHVSKGRFYFGTSELYRFYAGVEYKFRKKFSVAAGPTFNIYMSDALLPDYKDYQNVAPYALFNNTNADDFNIKGWVGGRVALRFL